MSDRPILFSAPMVRALLASRKTQTRRVIKGVPMFSADYDRQWSPNVIPPGGAIPNEWSWWEGPPHGQSCYHRARIPFAVGGRLWVKENFSIGVDADMEEATDPYSSSDRLVMYEGAEGEYCVPTTYDWPRKTKLYTHYAGTPEAWTEAGPISCRHMPRWASRLTLLVTNVRVERLQEISEVDAIDEGALTVDLPTHGASTERGRPPLGQSPRQRFQHLWEGINGPDAWAANPWVAAVTFAVHACNIDNLAASPGRHQAAGAAA